MTLTAYRFGSAAALALVLGLLGLLNSSEPVAHGQPPCTVTVQPGQSIQKAIDEAKEGAVICLESGTWNENLTVKKSLTLRGAGHDLTILDGNNLGDAHGITIVTSNAQVTIRGLTVRNFGGDGLKLEGLTWAILERNNIVKNKGYGVALHQRPCYDTDRIFSGFLSGKGNSIPGPEELEGNSKGSICPKELTFLKTAEGGEYLGPPLDGALDAKVTIVEFSDFMCPYCARFAVETLPKIREEYIHTGKVKHIFRSFPVYREQALRVAEAALCAHEQQRFWEYHDQLFADSRKRGASVFSIENLKSLAVQLGLDAERFNQCVDSRKHSQAVQRDIAEGQHLRVYGVPTFFINGRQIVGAQPYAIFKQVIEEELARKR